MNTFSAAPAALSPSDFDGTDETLFAGIASDLKQQGYSIRPTALPSDLAEALYAYQLSLSGHEFSAAGVGRGHELMQNTFVRTDEICWINGESDTGRRWLGWSGALQQFLNRRLFLGLFSFESHFAHYAPGDFYRRHLDAFKGQQNRVLSLVVYLNPGWQHDDGGELVLYRDESDAEGIRVTPLMGTVVVFLSEEFPHKVLAAQRDRYSIAGWFRVNSSLAGVIDPPR